MSTVFHWKMIDKPLPFFLTSSGYNNAGGSAEGRYAVVAEVFDKLVGAGKPQHRRDFFDRTVGGLEEFLGFFEFEVVDILFQSDTEITP